MKRLSKLVIAACTAFCLASCGQSQQNNLGPEIQSLAQKVKDLEDQNLKIERDVAFIKFFNSLRKSATFDPSEAKGYSAVETTIGTFLISVEDVTPYLDGVKVQLQIGNIQSATYSDFKINAEYGRRRGELDIKRSKEESDKLQKAYESAKRKKSETFTQTLMPGTWNTISLTLPDIKPDAFGELTLSLEASKVLLRTSR